jgi:hypothetical protein
LAALRVFDQFRDILERFRGPALARREASLDCLRRILERVFDDRLEVDASALGEIAIAIVSVIRPGAATGWFVTNDGLARGVAPPAARLASLPARRAPPRETLRRRLQTVVVIDIIVLVNV